MTYLFVIAIVGGAASVLTPCVLPLLPAILAVSGGAAAADAQRRRVWGIVLGIELSFFVLAIALAGVITSLGLPANTLRIVSAVLLAGFGVVLLVPKLHDGFTKVVSRLTSAMPARRATGTGFGAGLASGLPLGLVWAPCAGPILAGITVAASSSRFSSRTVLTMLGYALGMVGPLAAVVFGGQKLSTRLRRALGGGRRVLAPMGVVLLATAVLIGFGGLNTVNNFIARKINLTSTPTASLERRALGAGKTGNTTSSSPSGNQLIFSKEQLQNGGYPSLGSLKDLGQAPEVAGITQWYNTDGRALSLASLRGNVVLVDFWTYSCINCIRTLPHVRALFAKYKDQGLVVLGVHTPEFEFEKDPGNVGRAVRDFHIAYPVALDPDRKTWDNYYNQYWPADYLVDRNGHLRIVRYGEGEYVQTENDVRTLLGMKADATGPDTSGVDAATPETYLGYARAERFVGTPGIVNDRSTAYSAPSGNSLDIDKWSYAGRWTVGSESAVAGGDAHILIHFRAQNVYIVAGGTGTIAGALADGAQTVKVDGDKLYTVRSGTYSEKLLRLDISPGVKVYSFTFG